MSEENTIAPIVEDEVIVDENQGEQDVDIDLDVDMGSEEVALDDIEGYNPEDEKMVAYVGQLQEEAKAQGFNAEQTKWLISKSLAGLTEKEQPKERTTEEIKQHLKETLTPSELRSYNTTKNYIINNLRGTEYEGAIGEIIQNGHLVKIFNAMRERGSKGVQNAPVKKAQPTQKFDIPVDRALEVYTNFVATEGKNENFANRKQEFFNEMFNNANNSEELKAIFKSYL